MDWLIDKGWEGYVPASQVLSGFATTAALIIGAVSLCLLWFQTRHAAGVAREMAAYDAHKEYIRLCIDYPELSSSYMMARHLKMRDFSSILKSSTVDSERALWFVSHMLFAMEQLLRTNSRWGKVDPAWEATVKAQLGYHRELLATIWPEWKNHYGKQMNRVMTEILNEPISASEVLDIGSVGA